MVLVIFRTGLFIVCERLLTSTGQTKLTSWVHIETVEGCGIGCRVEFRIWVRVGRFGVVHGSLKVGPFNKPYDPSETAILSE